MSLLMVGIVGVLRLIDWYCWVVFWNLVVVLTDWGWWSWGFSLELGFCGDNGKKSDKLLLEKNK